jgi:hypothetical protein
LEAYPGAQVHGRQLGPEMNDPAEHRMACAAPPAQPYPGGHDGQAAQPEAAATLVDVEYVPTAHPHAAGWAAPPGQ